MDHWIESSSGGSLVRVHAQPRASRTETSGLHGDPPRLKIRLAAPPVDGEANDELIRFLSKCLGIPKSAITIVRGQSGRSKDVLCVGIAPDRAEKMLIGPK